MRRQDAPGFPIGAQEIVKRRNCAHRIAVFATAFNRARRGSKEASADIGGRSFDRMRRPRGFDEIFSVDLRSQLTGQIIGRAPESEHDIVNASATRRGQQRVDLGKINKVGGLAVDTHFAPV